MLTPLTAGLSPESSFKQVGIPAIPKWPSEQKPSHPASPTVQRGTWSELESLTRSAFDQWLGICRLKAMELTGFSAKVPLTIEAGRYRARTLGKISEITKVLKLRHQVFHQEGLGRTLWSGLDLDAIDFVCDHLAIEDVETGEFIGTYRLISSVFTWQFYAAKRFELDEFLALPGNKLELGRACVDPAHRNGATLALLWRGIREYARITHTEHLFGSVSLRTQDPTVVSQVFQYLESNGYTDSSYQVRPKSDVECPLVEIAKSAERRPELTPLFLSYLRAGAKVACAPVFDRYLASADFFSVVRMGALAKKFDRFNSERALEEQIS